MFEELREMNDLINRKQERIDELRTRLTSMSISYSERVQTSLSDKMADLTCKIIVMENELGAMIDDYSDMKSRAKKQIFTLDNEDWQDIVYAHYIERKTFKQIADQRGETYKAVSRKCERAVKTLKNIDRGMLL